MKKYLQTLAALLRGFGSGLKPVFIIFGHDVKRIFKSRATRVILLGLCLLPSLYAWINIYACWDPYSNTGNLPVAIVNKDQGAIYNGKMINVGSSVIDELKKNKSIGWEFVSEWQANYGLNEGKYYALIEIPENFSERLLTLTTTTPRKPEITYCVNEKLNSIATKITDAAETKLVNNIKTNFVKTVTTESINTLNTEMKSADLSFNDLGSLKDSIRKMNGDISRIKQNITLANTDSLNFQNLIKEYTDDLPEVSQQIASLQKIIEADKALSTSTEKTIESISTDFNTDIQQLTILDNYNQQIITLLKQANGNNIPSDTIAVMQQCSSLCTSIDTLLKSDSQIANNLYEDYHDNVFLLLKDSFDYMDKLVLSEQQALGEQIPVLSADNSPASVDKALTSLSGLSSEMSQRITKLSRSVQQDAMPMLSALEKDIEVQLDDYNTLVKLSSAVTPQLNALAIFSTSSSKLLVRQSGDVMTKLTAVQDSLTELLSKLNGISAEDMDYFIDVVQNHPDEIADFISSPIEVQEVDLYNNTTTFGVGLTPFYTVLAIWIGALLCCALLTVEYHSNGVDGHKLNLAQRHFGKMLLFLCLSLIQAFIIVLGDVFIMGVVPADFPLMLGLTALTSVTFTVIIFTLVSLFGNVGKAIIVVAMVFQIAGAGGIYPIQTNPAIFGLLQPLWPFTYAIDYFREAIAGPVHSIVLHNVEAMLIFIGVFLPLVALKKRLHVMNETLEHIYKQAHI